MESNKAKKMINRKEGVMQNRKEVFSRAKRTFDNYKQKLNRAE